jgi:hypothetical protein
MQEIVAKIADLTRRATVLAPDRPWLEAVADLRAAARARQHQNYGALGSVLQPYVERAGETIGGFPEMFLRLVLCELASDAITSGVAQGLRLPPSAQRLYALQVHRIRRESVDETLNHFRLNHDFFLKDLALVVGRLLPMGAELVQPHSGIPRSLLWHAGPKQFFAGIQYFIVGRRGFLDYCSLHLEGRQLQGFNPEGWRQTYLRIAELLSLNPGIAGVFGTAWFYDPVVAEISPHLAYLRTVREAGGARNFRGGTATYVTESAIAKSRRRAALYRQGKYQPRAYYLVWHRQELLRWAQMQGCREER